MASQKSKSQPALLTLGQFGQIIQQYGKTVNHNYGHDAVKRAYSMYLQGQMTVVATSAFSRFPADVARFEAQNTLLRERPYSANEVTA